MAASTPALPVPVQRWLRHYWLAVVMLAAYLMLSLLVIEQARVIDSQRILLRALFSDSLQLNAMRVQEHQRQLQQQQQQNK
jgi:hypothetical protein